MPADPEIPVKPGELLAGKYHVDRVMPPGGMGVVVVATHLELREPVCLKFMLRSIATADNVDRFVREARVAAKLRGSHICRVMDLSRLPDGVPFIVMELLRGTDLADLLEKKKRVRPLEAAEWIRQACDGIAEAHEHGIVHRDLKPANLYLTRTRDGSPHIKVLDFGCSKASFPDTQLTGTHAVFGTPAYMSPEQAKSAKRVDARTDIWALGAVLYELVSGRPPFNGETYAEIYAAVQRASPPPLRDVPAELAAIVEKCLRKDRARRFASCDELASALAAFITSGVSSPRTVMGRASGSAKRVTIREPRPVRKQPVPTPKRMTRALETAVAAMEGRGGATLQEIQRALANADLETLDAKALLLWAGKHRGLRYQVDLDGKVRRLS